MNSPGAIVGVGRLQFVIRGGLGPLIFGASRLPRFVRTIRSSHGKTLLSTGWVRKEGSMMRGVRMIKVAGDVASPDVLVQHKVSTSWLLIQGEASAS